MVVSLFGTTSIVTFISLLIFSFIPKLPLANDDIVSSLQSAIGSIGGIKQYLAIEEVMYCEFRFGDAESNLKLAITNYQNGHFKDVINQIDEALKSIKSCQDTSDAQGYIARSVAQDMDNVVLLINKIKKQVLGSALSPQIYH
ncbi:hypothetical protein RDI58_005127 [Solanum bulbocastanum]|uniref:Pectinesterase inhibitor domain-containing protein n=1 Tax=Solanum bulbocastanum TaxID=147425 RepID=A0AAN8YM40_SOLBU